MATTTSPGEAGPHLLRRIFNRPEGGLLLSILVVVVLTALVDQQHNYWVDPGSNALEILRETAFLGIFALGAAIIIIAGGIDLSSGSAIAFGGSFCATVMVLLAPEEMRSGKAVGLGVIVLAVAATLVAGFLIGSFHAWLINIVGLPPFVATLATLVGLRSLAQAMVEKVTAVMWDGKSTQIKIYDENQLRILTKEIWIPIGTFILLALLAWLLLSRTVVGRHLHALGGNEQAARLSGIRTDRLKWLAYCIGALLSTLAGIFYISYQSAADPQTLGRGYELNAIAAAVVGGCSLKGGVGSIPGTVLGTVFMRTVIDGVAMVIKTGAYVYEGLIVGSVVVVAVAFNQLRQAGRTGKQFFPGVLGLVTVVTLALLAGAMAALFGQQTVIASWGGSGAIGMVTLVLLFVVRFYEGRRASAKTMS